MRANTLGHGHVPRATLELTIPEGVWIGDLSRCHPETRIRVLAALPDGDAGVGLVEVTSERTDAVLDGFREADAVVAVDVLRRGDPTALVQFETTTPLLLVAARDSGVPLEMPFDVRDGELTWELTAARERLSELGSRLESLGVPFTVSEIGRRVDEPALLTDRQESLLRTAVERGYYDTPRNCTLTELADHVGVAKSTCSETLHRAESRVVRRFVGDDPALDARLSD
jgi:predicted DNA binding protein